jgi:uncharacterized protein (DUF1499 family)
MKTNRDVHGRAGATAVVTATGLTLALASAAVLLLAPLGVRVGLWSYAVGLGLLAVAVILALGAVVLSSIGVYTTTQWWPGTGAIAVGLIVIAVPAFFIVSAFGAPPIHDITTDTQDPPSFAAVLPLRRGAVNPAEYEGERVAEQQRRAYADLQPVKIPVPVPQAFERSLSAARALGWEIVASDVNTGRIEAVDTTFWFGFKDDIVIRVRDDAEGSRIDVRSKSRVGIGDAGANARRIRAFVESMHARSRQSPLD